MCGTCVRQDPEKNIFCMSRRQGFLECFILENGTDRLFRNAGNYLSTLLNIAAERISEAGGLFHRIPPSPPFIRMEGLRKTRKTSVRVFLSKCRGADKFLARSTSRCILFDGENISFDASLAVYINSTNIPPIMIINRICENQNLLSLLFFPSCSG
jgi:hypothetical protein